jgi:hypothetical protein
VTAIAEGVLETRAVPSGDLSLPGGFVADTDDVGILRRLSARPERWRRRRTRSREPLRLGVHNPTGSTRSREDRARRRIGVEHDAGRLERLPT